MPSDMRMQALRPDFRQALRYLRRSPLLPLPEREKS
jgi:hypothetical protein